MRSIEEIEKHGFTLINSKEQWYHFRGNDFDVYIGNSKEFKYLLKIIK